MDRLPFLRITISYDTDMSRILVPYKLTIRNANHTRKKWEIYDNEIPCIESLYWIFQMTPPIVRALIIDCLQIKIENVERHRNKLHALMERIDKIIIPARLAKINPHIHVEGNHYLNSYFETANEQIITLDDIRKNFKRVIRRFLTIKIRNYPGLLRQGASRYVPYPDEQVYYLVSDFHANMRTLQNYFEHFYIILRFYRDLRSYLPMRKGITIYQLEVQQINDVAKSFCEHSKQFFKKIESKEQQELSNKMYDKIIENSKIYDIQMD